MTVLTYAHQRALDADGSLHLGNRVVGTVKGKKALLSPWLGKGLLKGTEALCRRMGYVIIGREKPIDVPLTRKQARLEPALLKPRGTRR